MARFLASHSLRPEYTRGATAGFEAFAKGAKTYARVANYCEASDKRRGLVWLEGDARDLAAKSREAGPGIILEPQWARHPAVFAPHQSLAVPLADAAEPAAGFGDSLELTILGDGAAVVADVAVIFVNRTSGKAIPISAAADGQGVARLTYNAAYWHPATAIVTPRCGFWSHVWPNPQSGASFPLAPLQQDGPLGWWHRLMGIGEFTATRGQGIRIGMADTGVGPNPALGHGRSLGAFLNGAHDTGKNAANDVSVHGTHVAGILAGRPKAGSTDFAGVAPGAELVYARVYPAASQPEQAEANNGDIAAAIDALAHQKVDLINLSLGGTRSSAIEDDAIQAAIDRGVLVICSAGNAGGVPILFPAASPGAVAVTALGLAGTYAPASVDSLALPATLNPALGGLFAASFNNTGPQIACTGPGVGIISTVPGGQFAAMSGTSMACPAVCAALAGVLAGDPEYLKLPRDRSRAVYAWATLLRTVRPLGLGQAVEGYGLISAAGASHAE